jgi:NAD(P)-dependent dehydrogenase (short-subunit alcohol dehydrogenase family)
VIDFDGQVAIVTGAGRGMGRSIALLLARRGASVLVNDYGGDEFGNPGTSREAEAVTEEIRALGGRAVANSVTVGAGAGADAIVNAALAAFGRVDVLINNAGGSTIAQIDELTDAALERVMRTNYWGAYMLIRRVWPHMRTQRYGRIINVCSSAVLGIGTIAPYSSAKGAMVGLTHEAAIEGKPHGILVNGTFPAGYSRLVAKSAEDARRWMETYFQPELVAQAYAYFASREMEHTGDIYSVGAGRVSRIAFVNNDGYFNRELTPELVAQNIERIRDLNGAVHVGSSWEENQRYQRFVPWTGGQGGTFGGAN